MKDLLIFYYKGGRVNYAKLLNMREEEVNRVVKFFKELRRRIRFVPRFIDKHKDIHCVYSDGVCTVYSDNNNYLRMK